jgi:hypothetical protein
VCTVGVETGMRCGGVLQFLESGLDINGVTFLLRLTTVGVFDYSSEMAVFGYKRVTIHCSVICCLHTYLREIVVSDLDSCNT